MSDNTNAWRVPRTSKAQSLPTATRAQAAIAAIAAWPGVILEPASPISQTMHFLGYRAWLLDAALGKQVFLCIAPSAPDVVELQSIRAGTEGQGYGTAILSKLCTILDQHQLTCWLDARPFGNAKQIISQAALVQWYKRLGFGCVTAIPHSWVKYTHGRNYQKHAHLMLRQPKRAHP